MLFLLLGMRLSRPSESPIALNACPNKGAQFFRLHDCIFFIQSIILAIHVAHMLC